MRARDHDVGSFCLSVTMGKRRSQDVPSAPQNTPHGPTTRQRARRHNEATSAVLGGALRTLYDDTDTVMDDDEGTEGMDQGHTEAVPSTSAAVAVQAAGNSAAAGGSAQPSIITSGGMVSSSIIPRNLNNISGHWRSTRNCTMMVKLAKDSMWGPIPTGGKPVRIEATESFNPGTYIVETFMTSYYHTIPLHFGCVAMVPGVAQYLNVQNYWNVKNIGIKFDKVDIFHVDNHIPNSATSVASVSTDWQPRMYVINNDKNMPKFYNIYEEYGARRVTNLEDLDRLMRESQHDPNTTFPRVEFNMGINYQTTPESQNPVDIPGLQNRFSDPFENRTTKYTLNTGGLVIEKKPMKAWRKGFDFLRNETQMFDVDMPVNFTRKYMNGLRKVDAAGKNYVEDVTSIMAPNNHSNKHPSVAQYDRTATCRGSFQTNHDGIDWTKPGVNNPYCAEGALLYARNNVREHQFRSTADAYFPHIKDDDSDWFFRFETPPTFGNDNGEWYARIDFEIESQGEYENPMFNDSSNYYPYNGAFREMTGDRRCHMIQNSYRPVNLLQGRMYEHIVAEYPHDVIE